jgi:hypothetical protein
MEGYSDANNPHAQGSTCARQKALYSTSMSILWCAQCHATRVSICTSAVSQRHFGRDGTTVSQRHFTYKRA